ncbi:Flp family type IVb pilin [Jannaschia aquimarina]|uniref:Uncharacterized protein n=1 Tax=Jannaschia aquimarina TaxID=935700 RepID=A0A0D1EJF1_9RHOB|nr:hypothetical protein [Jannaschia aquimarina]KIT17724.1 hypothetical protein jaqu_06150 [Jannaschia aquimarina]SNS78102.1 hypothetical protein SAMN05421775_102266 [Jannaschia aquimarina]
MKYTVQTFIRSERGAITVDWSIMTALVTGTAIVAAGVMFGGIDRFTTNLAADAQTNASAKGDIMEIRHATLNEDGTPVEFGFLGRSPTTTKTVAKVSCGEFTSNCGKSSETVSEHYFMTDGTTYTKSTTSYAGGSSETTWYDGNGRVTTNVPDLPSDLPTVSAADV